MRWSLAATTHLAGTETGTDTETWATEMGMAATGATQQRIGYNMLILVLAFLGSCLVFFWLVGWL
jgi:hypothetical protein